MTDVFPWTPDNSFSEAHEPRIRKTLFGDGYEQRSGSGVVSDLGKWSLTFSGRTETEARAITAFLAEQGGVTPFTWMPPGPWPENLIPRSEPERGPSTYNPILIPCVPGDRFYAEAFGRVDSGEGNFYSNIYRADSTAIMQAGVKFTNTSYQKVSFTVTVPAEGALIYFYADPTAPGLRLKNLYAGRMWAGFQRLVVCSKWTITTAHSNSWTVTAELCEVMG